MFNTFFLLHSLIYRVLCQKGFEKYPSQKTSLDRLGNMANIGICFYVLKFSKEDCFTLSCYILYCPMCRALYEREFEPPNSQSMSKEKLRNIVNIGIQSYITKFCQKCFILSVYYTVLHGAHLRKNQETQQVSIFGLIILN